MMTGRVVSLGLVAAIASACTFKPGTLSSQDGPIADGAADTGAGGSPDAAPNCYGASPHFVCLTTPSPDPVTLDDMTIVTSDGQCPGDVVTPSAGPQLCVLSGSSITITGLARFEGTRPLVLFSSGDITVMASGTVDVSSYASRPTSGAGANDSSCVLGNGGNDGGGGGGGAGGSFGTQGGRGGNGVGAGGTAGPTATPTTIRGGCPGGNGGDGGNPGGAGGDSGGVVYFIAEGTLSIAGSVDASAEGGKLGPSGKNGGGGGGSGGMIALYGRTGLNLTGSVFANGGGGGGGGDGSNGQNGDESIGPTDVAAGGNAGGANAGAGGAGAIGVLPGTQGEDATKPGGGGGGGVGVVRNLSGQSLAGSISPPPS